MYYNFQLRQFKEIKVLPQKIAVAGSDGDIDWQTLQELVIKLSGLFQELKVPHGHPVVIFGHKEYLFPVAMLACMHAGIPYIPIDKIYPSERIRKIVETTGSQLLINCSDDAPDIPFAITINSKLKAKIHTAPDYSNRIYGNGADILQYIMFTSGSTGEPKGVQITRNAVLTFLDWVLRDFGFRPEDVFLNQAPFTFDVSLCDVLNAFARGATLVLTSTDIVKNQDAFIARLAHYKCSVWTSTPSFIYLFLRHPDFHLQHLPSFREFLFMGEELPLRTVGILKNNFRNARVLNAYGPTEATIVTTLVDITEEMLNKYNSAPIGFPMPGSELLIQKEKPEDKEGELIIVGNHVSTGYFKRPELNRQKFYLHNGKRAFKTGDLAYYEDGMLFFIGRNDDQVKMHGFRIELNEISNVICKHGIIADAVTVALKRGNEVKKIISFLITKNELTDESVKTELLPYLEKNLPYYMIPGDLMMVKEFPYSTSHKIDKNKLIDVYLEKQLSGT